MGFTEGTWQGSSPGPRTPPSRSPQTAARAGCDRLVIRSLRVSVRLTFSRFNLALEIKPVFIRQGQVVVITYTDPTTGDDTLAIQDAAGNDAASFTTGMNSVPAVINNSTQAAVAPNAPTGLTATASGTDTINLSWTAPVDNGGRVITGYKIEVSIDSGTTWTDLVADTASTTTTYEHTGLAASTRRDYRVSAINSIGTGTTPSDVVDATTGAPANMTPRHATFIPQHRADISATPRPTTRSTPTAAFTTAHRRTATR